MTWHALTKGWISKHGRLSVFTARASAAAEQQRISATSNPPLLPQYCAFLATALYANAEGRD
jgi:hypothetical protein